MNQLRDSKTRINLMKAFAGESQARNRYTFGASQAKGEKLALIEQAFLYTADQERAHAKVFYNHLKELSGGTIHIDGGYPEEIFDNIAHTLRAAQHDEYEEWEKVYKSFANTAREEGFLAVANSFDKIAQIEKIHGDRFGNFAQKIEDGTLFKSDKKLLKFVQYVNTLKVILYYTLTLLLEIKNKPCRKIRRGIFMR